VLGKTMSGTTRIMTSTKRRKKQDSYPMDVPMIEHRTGVSSQSGEFEAPLTPE
jgi:hypothetical protein